MATLKGHITKYRSQLEDMREKIVQLDISQKCLAEMSKVEHNESTDPCTRGPTVRAERVKEERTLVKGMKDEYTRLQSKLKKEHDMGVFLLVGSQVMSGNLAYSVRLCLCPIVF